MNSLTPASCAPGLPSFGMIQTGQDVDRAVFGCGEVQRLVMLRPSGRVLFRMPVILREHPTAEARKLACYRRFRKHL
jgi:hypothetical protein